MQDLPFVLARIRAVRYTLTDIRYVLEVKTKTNKKTKTKNKRKANFSFFLWMSANFYTFFFTFFIIFEYFFSLQTIVAALLVQGATANVETDVKPITKVRSFPHMHMRTHTRLHKQYAVIIIIIIITTTIIIIIAKIDCLHTPPRDMDRYQSTW